MATIKLQSLENHISVMEESAQIDLDIDMKSFHKKPFIKLHEIRDMSSSKFIEITVMIDKIIYYYDAP